MEGTGDTWNGGRGLSRAEKRSWDMLTCRLFAWHLHSLTPSYTHPHRGHQRTSWKATAGGDKGRNSAFFGPKGTSKRVEGLGGVCLGFGCMQFVLVVSPCIAFGGKGGRGRAAKWRGNACPDLHFVDHHLTFHSPSFPFPPSLPSLPPQTLVYSQAPAATRTNERKDQSRHPCKPGG